LLTVFRKFGQYIERGTCHPDDKEYLKENYLSSTRFGDEGEGLAPDRAAKPGFFYGYVVTAAAFTVYFLGCGPYHTYFGVFLKPLLNEFGWTRAEASLGFSICLLLYGFLSIFAGWLTDRLGPRVVVTVFGSFLGICYLLLSQVNALWQFQLIYVLMGAIGLSAILVPLMSTMAKWFARKRGMMTGFVQAGAGVGGLVLTPLAGWLILAYGWRSAYVVLGCITLTVIIISGLFLKRNPKDVGQLPDGLSEVISPELQKNRPGLQSAGGLSFREAIRTSQFWMIIGLYFGFGFLRSTFLAHIAAHVQDLGFSLVHGANVSAVIIGATIIGRIGMGRVADIIGNRSAYMISLAVTAVILIWGLVTEDLWGLYLFALIFGIGWGAQAVLRFSVSPEIFGLASLGLIMGAFAVAEASASTFGLYFAGYIFDTIGNYDPVFWIGTAVSVMGIILAWLLKPAIGKEGVTRGKETS